MAQLERRIDATIECGISIEDTFDRVVVEFDRIQRTTTDDPQWKDKMRAIFDKRMAKPSVVVKQEPDERPLLCRVNAQNPIIIDDGYDGDESEIDLSLTYDIILKK